MTDCVKKNRLSHQKLYQHGRTKEITGGINVSGQIHYISQEKPQNDTPIVYV